jgi:hypothetical protein
LPVFSLFFFLAAFKALNGRSVIALVDNYQQASGKEARTHSWYTFKISL